MDKFLIGLPRRLANAGCLEPGLELDKLKGQLNRDVLRINIRRAQEMREHHMHITRLKEDARLRKRHLSVLDTAIGIKKNEAETIGINVELLDPDYSIKLPKPIL